MSRPLFLGQNADAVPYFRGWTIRPPHPEGSHRFRLHRGRKNRQFMKLAGGPENPLGCRMATPCLL